jgi:O-methyltransferase
VYRLAALPETQAPSVGFLRLFHDSRDVIVNMSAIYPKWPALMPQVAQIVPRRRYLLCVRIGRDSVFERWFEADKPREWDLLLSYYAFPSGGPLPSAQVVSLGGLSKFSAIKDIYDKDKNIFREYQAIWFLDDDIDLAFGDVDNFFNIMRELNLSLAQPSLSADSFRNFDVTTNCAECVARHSNFVEIMMPSFSQEAFQRCVDTFDKSISGWGLDYVWSKLLGYNQGHKMGIVDAVVAKHTAPVDTSNGPFYTYLRSIGVDAYGEMDKLKREFGVSTNDYPRTLCNILKDDRGAFEGEFSRILTNHGTIIYLDEQTCQLRHGLLETSPQNVFLVRHGSSGRLVHRVGGLIQQIACQRESCKLVNSDDLKQTQLEITPALPDLGKFGLKAEGVFLSAKLSGEVVLSQPECRAWEEFRFVSQAVRLRDSPMDFFREITHTKTIEQILKQPRSPMLRYDAETLNGVRRLYLDTMERILVGMIYRDASQEPWGAKVFNASLREQGRDWPAFAHTMIGLKRLHNLRELAEVAILNGIAGDFIETGVWRGGACILMRAILRAYDCKDRRVFVADSFEGLPTPDHKYLEDRGDIHHTYRELAVSKGEVENNFQSYGLLDEQVVFLKGWFKDTLKTAPIKHLAILRLDGDMYESTIDALTNLYPKLTNGGFCIVDDGNVPNCRAAITDYRRDNNINDAMIDIDGWGFYWQKS